MNTSLPDSVPTTLTGTLKLNGSIEFLAPDSQQILTASRAEFRLHSEAAYQELELKVEGPPGHGEAGAVSWSGVHRFSLKPEILEAILPTLTASEEVEVWLGAGEGAVLQLGNYEDLGPSSWFEDRPEGQTSESDSDQSSEPGHPALADPLSGPPDTEPA